MKKFSKIVVLGFLINLVISAITPNSIAFTCSAEAICTEPNNQLFLYICSDDEGSAFITWSDNRSGLGYDIYAQKVNVNGNKEWGTSGIVICTTEGDQWFSAICSDGNGGAIITWTNESEDLRYAQRIDANGDLLWNISGVLISTRGYRICSDNSGGAIIAWQHQEDLYAQRVSSNGTVMWGSAGLTICNATYTQENLQFFCNENGTSFFTWTDYRKGESSPAKWDTDIFIQLVDINGIIQLQPNGTEICSANDYQIYPSICTDGVGGAFINWVDLRDQLQIYAQRINSTGDIEWTSNGTLLANSVDLTSSAVMCSDDNGGAVIAFRHILYRNLYILRLNLNGTMLYSKLLYNATIGDTNPSNLRICKDGNGGAFITWDDQTDPFDSDIGAQRVDSNGNLEWSETGKVICDEPSDQSEIEICSYGLGSAFISWSDNRNGLDSDIYFTLLGKRRESETISFGNTFLVLTVFSILALVIVSRRHVNQNTKN